MLLLRLTQRSALRLTAGGGLRQGSLQLLHRLTIGLQQDSGGTGDRCAQNEAGSSCQKLACAQSHDHLPQATVSRSRCYKTARLQSTQADIGSHHWPHTAHTVGALHRC